MHVEVLRALRCLPQDAVGVNAISVGPQPHIGARPYAMHPQEFVQQQQHLERKQTVGSVDAAGWLWRFSGQPHKNLLSDHLALQARQLLVQRLENPRDQQQLERAAYLLVYALRLDSDQTPWQQTQLYPTLLQLLRAGSQHHGQNAITVILEAIAVIARQDSCGCSILLDLGIVT